MIPPEILKHNPSIKAWKLRRNEVWIEENLDVLLTSKLNITKENLRQEVDTKMFDMIKSMTHDYYYNNYKEEIENSHYHSTKQLEQLIRTIQKWSTQTFYHHPTHKDYKSKEFLKVKETFKEKMKDRIHDYLKVCKYRDVNRELTKKIRHRNRTITNALCLGIKKVILQRIGE